MKLIVSLIFLFLIGCTAQQTPDSRNVSQGEQNRRDAKSYLDATEADGKPANLMNRPFPQPQTEEEPKEESKEEPKEEPKQEKDSDSSTDDSEIPGEDF